MNTCLDRILDRNHMLARVIFEAPKVSSSIVRRLFTRSYVEGPLQPPLETLTLGDYFNSAVLRAFPTRPALICKSERPRTHHGPPSRNMEITTHLAWDFAEFGRHIDSLAWGLLGLGVRKGDRVGVIMGNNRLLFYLHLDDIRYSVLFSYIVARTLCCNGLVFKLGQFWSL